MTHLRSLICLSLLLVGCRGGELTTELYPSGAKRAEGRVVEDASGATLRSGPWTFWYASGGKEAEGAYKNGRPDGEVGETGILKDGREGTWTVWYESGAKKSDATFAAGQNHGPSRTYFEGGAARSEAAFSRGLLDGVARTWREDGGVEEERRYRMGVADGPSRRFNTRGHLVAAGRFVGGRRAGVWSTWHPGGEPKEATAYLPAPLPVGESASFSLRRMTLKLGTPSSDLKASDDYLDTSMPDGGRGLCSGHARLRARTDEGYLTEIPSPKETCLLLSDDDRLVGVDALYRGVYGCIPCTQGKAWTADLAAMLEAMGAGPLDLGEVLKQPVWTRGDGVRDRELQVSGGGLTLSVRVSDADEEQCHEECSLRIRAPAPEPPVAAPSKPRDASEVVCWGENEWGELDAPKRAFTEVSAGDGWTCGLDPKGGRTCWGREDDALTLGWYGAPLASISAGDSHGCAIREGGRLQCWGASYENRTTPAAGPGFSQVSAGGDHSCAIDSLGSVHCWGSWRKGETSPPPERFRQVSAGNGFACGVDESSSVQCWGDLVDGLDAAPEGRFTQVDAGYRTPCALGEDGAATCWGAPDAGLRTAAEGPFTEIAVGAAHACGVRRDGRVGCWGEGPAATAPADSRFRGITAGGVHSCGVLR